MTGRAKLTLLVREGIDAASESAAVSSIRVNISERPSLYMP